jgi:RNA polymerase sigma factor (TIGR02999 family)
MNGAQARRVNTAEVTQALPYPCDSSHRFGRQSTVYNADVRPSPPWRLPDSPALLGMESTVSSLITSAEGGDPSAIEALFTALYSDLRKLAGYELSRRGGGVTLTATALLHEAYLDISKRDGAMFVDRGRFMAYASRVMRGLIIDYARNRRAQKRGGLFELTTLETDVGEPVVDDRELTAISEALDELASVDAALAQIVDLKFFCGFSFAEIAGMRGISERTVQRQWDKARIYLHGALRDARPLS